MLAAPPSRGPSPPHAGAALDPFLSPSPAFLFAPSPSSSLAPSPTLHSATLPAPQQHARRMRRLSRHSRPSSANGAAHLGVPHLSPPPPVPSLAGRRDSAAGTRTSSGSSSRQPSPGAPSGSARREAASSQRVGAVLGFTLPLFVQPDEAVSPPPAPASAQYLSVSPTQPMRHNSYKAPRSPVQVSDSLPRSRSLRVTLPAPPRSSSALFEASAAGPSSQPDGDDASRSRRWSSSISHSRSAQIFKQAASPYLRAGLEELRSIFDVDSDPIPTSPFDEESDEQAADGSPLMGQARSQRELLPSSHPPEPHASERSRCRSDSVRTPRRSGAAAVEASLLPTAQNPMASPSPRRAPGGPLSAARSPPMSPPQRSNSGEAMSSLLDEKLAAHGERRRSGDDFALLMPLASGKGTPGLLGDDAAYRPDHVAAGLVAIALGITTACIWGYRTYADIFSPSLLIFFLVQPGFALMGAAAVCLRRRNLMDLFSRAMRAHVLAQALIALLAFLDLSASASYVRTTAFGGASTWVMDLVPSMQTRFGPLGAPFDAGTAPAASLLAAAHASQGAAQVHAHDTAVGGISSRVTHLIIFVAQAAAPLLLTLWAQYALARTLGFLARQGLKRSSRAPSRRTSAKRAPRAAVPSNSTAHIAPPPLDVAELSARLQRIDANKLRRVSEAGVPAPDTRAHTLALGEAFGEPAPAPSHGFSLARAQPSQRAGHSRHNRSLSQPVAALASRRLSIHVPPPAQHAVELQQSPSMVSSPARPRLSDGPSSPLRHALVESPESEDPSQHWSSRDPQA